MENVQQLPLRMILGALTMAAVFGLHSPDAITYPDVLFALVFMLYSDLIPLYVHTMWLSVAVFSKLN